jgi:hypothetical protein
MQQRDHTADEDMLPANHVDHPKINDLTPEPITIMLKGRMYELRAYDENFNDGSLKGYFREVAPF